MFLPTQARPLLVLVLIPTPPQKARWRVMIRGTLGELTSGVMAVGLEVRIIVRFAVGNLTSYSYRAKPPII